jgi:hypothetical protein
MVPVPLDGSPIYVTLKSLTSTGWVTENYYFDTTQ